MPDTNLAEQIKTMLEEVKGQLETKTEDGQVIKLLDIFKAFPCSRRNTAPWKSGWRSSNSRPRARKWATGAHRPGAGEGKILPVPGAACHAHRQMGQGQFEAEVFGRPGRKHRDDSDGGYLVPAQAMPEFIEMFRAEAVCIRMGAGSSTASPEPR